MNQRIGVEGKPVTQWGIFGYYGYVCGYICVLYICMGKYGYVGIYIYGYVWVRKVRYELV